MFSFSTDAATNSKVSEFTIYSILIKQYKKHFLYKIKITNPKENEENKIDENNQLIKNKTQENFTKNNYIIYNRKKDLNRKKKK